MPNLLFIYPDHSTSLPQWITVNYLTIEKTGVGNYPNCLSKERKKQN